jgi:hypothetical protein
MRLRKAPRLFVLLVLPWAAIALAASAGAQTPVPFPRPGTPVRSPTSPSPPAGTTQPATPPQPAPPGEPTEATLGVPIYPSAKFIASYDAGQGQRYYLFGTETDFAQVVTFYKTMLKQKGDLVFEEPPVHMFDTGRFREETMAFPPSVTVKDYTWGGSLGYLNPKRGATPARYKTIIQIVPAPPGTPK